MAELQEKDLLGELERLEALVQEVSREVQHLREEKRKLERECEQLRVERSATVERLSRVIEKVDALRGES